MSVLRIGALVEGEGDAVALPKLVHRVALRIGVANPVVVRPVIPSPASRLWKERSLEHQLDNLARQVRGGGILVLLDCDWDGGCPKHDGPAWLKRAQTARPDLLIRLVLAHKEYESWFVAAAESLRGVRGLPDDLSSPANPEGIRGAKEWLTQQMPGRSPYSPVPDQAILTSVFDLDLARQRSPSFDKCYREISAMLHALTEASDA
jgi:hypothetical protein